MSKVTPETKKSVKIKENDLIELIDKIVNEAVDSNRKKWLAEEASKTNSILESKISALEAKFTKLTEGKK